MSTSSVYYTANGHSTLDAFALLIVDQERGQEAYLFQHVRDVGETMLANWILAVAILLLVNDFQLADGKELYR